MHCRLLDRKYQKESVVSCNVMYPAINPERKELEVATKVFSQNNFLQVSRKLLQILKKIVFDNFEA